MKKIQARKFTALLALILCFSMLAACSDGGSSSGTTTTMTAAAEVGEDKDTTEKSEEDTADSTKSNEAAPIDPDAPITLRFATGATDGLGVLNEISANFTADHPNVTVEYTVLPNGVAGFNSAMASKLAANDAPDLFNYQWGSQITAYARGGHLLDITDIGLSDQIKDIKKPVNVFQGKVYAYPILQQLWGLMYNQEVAEAAGVTEIPKTLDQFTDAMDKIRANGIEYPFIVPAKDGSGATGFVFCYLHQVVSADNPDFYYETLTGEKGWDGDEWKNLFDVYSTLLEYTSPDKLGLDPDNALTRFARSEGAFLVTSPSNVKRVEEMNPELAEKILYIPFPLYENEADYGTIADYDAGVSIWSGTKYPEASIEFMKFLFTAENNTNFAIAMNGVSTIKGTPDSSVDPSLVGQLPLLEEGKFHGYSEREWVPGIKEIMKTHVQEWMAGTSLEDTLAALEADHQRLLDASPEFIEDFEYIRENTVN